MVVVEFENVPDRRELSQSAEIVLQTMTMINTRNDLEDMISYFFGCGARRAKRNHHCLPVVKSFFSEKRMLSQIYTKHQNFH